MSDQPEAADLKYQAHSLKEAYERAKAELLIKIAEIRELRKVLDKETTVIARLKIFENEARIVIKEIYNNRYNAVYINRLCQDFLKRNSGEF